MILQTIETITRYVRTDMTPPYVPVLPDMNLTVIKSVTLEDPLPQKCAHGVYAELLHTAILPSNLTDTTINSMQAYGITSQNRGQRLGSICREPLYPWVHLIWLRIVFIAAGSDR
jgi:hypothetical protein